MFVYTVRSFAVQMALHAWSRLSSAKRPSVCVDKWNEELINGMATRLQADDSVASAQPTGDTRTQKTIGPMIIEVEQIRWNGVYDTERY